MAATVIRNAKAMSPHLSTFCGALVGAVIGDCLGAKFEGIDYIRAEVIMDHFARLESGRNTFILVFIVLSPTVSGRFRDTDCTSRLRPIG